MSADKFTEKNQEKDEPNVQELKKYGYGIRHLQMFCMFLTTISLIISRACMGVAVLAMSDGEHHKHTYNNATCNNMYNSSIDNNTYSDSTNCNATYYNGTNSGIMQINDDGIVTYNWDKNTQSIILSSFFWGYMCIQIPAGIIAKKFGGWPLLLFALISNAVICSLIPTLAAVGGWMLVCVCRGFIGLTQGCLFPGTHTLLGQWLPANERTVYAGIVYGGVNIGTVLAMPVSGVLAETAIGWKLIFYVIAGILFFNAAVWYFLAANSPKEHKMISIEERQYIEAGLNVSNEKKPPPTPWKHILTCVPMWVLLAPHSGFVAAYVLFLMDLPTYLEKALHISFKNSAILSSLPYIGMWVGGTVASFLSEWTLEKGWIKINTSRKLFQSIAHIGLASGLIVLSLLGPEQKTLAVVSLITLMTLSGFALAGFLVNQLDLSPNYAGVMIAISNFAASIISGLMPLGTSYILQNDPTNFARWKILFLIMAALNIVSNIVYVIFGTSKRQDWDDPNFLKKLSADPEEMQLVLEKPEKEEKKNEVTEDNEKITENKTTENCKV